MSVFEQLIINAINITMFAIDISADNIIQRFAQIIRNL